MKKGKEKKGGFWEKEDRTLRPLRAEGRKRRSRGSAAELNRQKSYIKSRSNTDLKKEKSLRPNNQKEKGNIIKKENENVRNGTLLLFGGGARSRKKDDCAQGKKRGGGATLMFSDYTWG